MIIDSSVLIAILKAEEGFEELIATIVSDRKPSSISAASYVEVSILIDRVGDPVLSGRLDQLIHDLVIVVQPVSTTQAQIARQAYRDFGKGSGHPAQLNFGDCFSYALAKESREPLLFKGNDFSHTDLQLAV